MDQHTHRTRALIAIAATASCVTFMSAPASAASDPAMVEATVDGYRYIAEAGQDNHVIVTARARFIEINDTAITTFGEIPDGCSPAPADAGAAIACPYTSSTVLQFRLGDGSDFLDGETLPRKVAVWFTGGDGDNVVLGGAADDRLTGGDDPAARDTMYGGAGDDILHGRSGNSYLRGHAGNDHLTGGPGLDFIIGDGGDDTASGDDDLDFIDGGAGDDLLGGGGGRDSITGGGGNDRLFGQDGDDFLDGDRGNDWLFGGAGDDDLVTQRDRVWDVAECGPGADTAWVDPGNRDLVWGCENVTLEKY